MCFKYNNRLRRQTIKALTLTEFVATGTGCEATLLGAGDAVSGVKALDLGDGDGAGDGVGAGDAEGCVSIFEGCER